MSFGNRWVWIIDWKRPSILTSYGLCNSGTESVGGFYISSLKLRGYSTTIVHIGNNLITLRCESFSIIWEHRPVNLNSIAAKYLFHFIPPEAMPDVCHQRKLCRSPLRESAWQHWQGSSRFEMTISKAQYDPFTLFDSTTQKFTGNRQRKYNWIVIGSVSFVVSSDYQLSEPC